MNFTKKQMWIGIAIIMVLIVWFITDGIWSVRAYGNMTIHEAAIAGNIKAMKCLKMLGADINAGTYFGYTPMHLAALHGRIESMKWLKKHGVDINAKNEYTGDSLMNTAALGGQVDVMR